MQSDPSTTETIRAVLRDGEYSKISKATLFAALTESGACRASGSRIAMLFRPDNTRLLG